MGCDCRKSLGVRHIMTVGDNNAPKNADSNSNVNETTDRKEKLKVLREMWEAAKKKKEESRNSESQKEKPQENDGEK